MTVTSLLLLGAGVVSNLCWLAFRVNTTKAPASAADNVWADVSSYGKGDALWWFRDDGRAYRATVVDIADDCIFVAVVPPVPEGVRSDVIRVTNASSMRPRNVEEVAHA